ncbi:mannitol dehydrogenase family protein [Thorsellia anophelis]|uniref:Mannitol 2-dehydrogenase n=1 Tax=Thorsellia anophelis DSM 18579 TaxID=1123402 RepID=A0A1I0F8R9_9GAMM|nr:mannitol dehydrogenase family protein [Thorsellia anophelis]SET53514.1 mannitol 2-dehydrogenase [Thorsellia anophelis DSM 18579]
MITLSNQSLSQLSVEVPKYDRQKVKVGIVHFGVGAFHRVHQAMYLDDLLNAGEAFDYGICGVGVMPSDVKMRDALKAQDCLYTMVIKHPDGHYQARVIGSIVDYLFAPDNPKAVIECMASETVKIVSLTITEGGYNFDHVTGEFNLDNPTIIHDLNSDEPKSAFGLITSALALRRQKGLAPFTIQSCDNIQGNGDVAKKMFVAYAKAKDLDLGNWIEGNVAFPNSMVDRIAPVTTPDDIQMVQDRFEINDAFPSVCEPFCQWVIEDHFTSGRPNYEKVGAQLVDDVEAYELMKLRLLNASHQALTYFGYLAGYRYAHEVCSDSDFVEFLLNYMDLEATPTLRPIEGIDLHAYKRTLIERFANPEVRDTLARLCAESSDRIPKWLLPVIREQLAMANPAIKRSVAVVASWARYAEGKDEQGHDIVVVDRLKDELMAIAATQETDELAFIRNRNVFGDLIDNAYFVECYQEALRMLKSQGAKQTVIQFK